MFCERASCRPSKGHGEALPARRPIPASATPTPAPWQDLDTVGVDVFPARPHPMVLTEPQIPEPSPPAGRACVSLPPGASGGRGAHAQLVSTCVCSSQPRDPEAQARRPFWIIPACSDSTLSSGDWLWLWLWGASCPELDACTWPGQPCGRIAESRRFPRPGAGLHYQQWGQEAMATRLCLSLPSRGLSPVVSTVGPGGGPLVSGLALECL